jgi:hypothetical protein
MKAIPTLGLLSLSAVLAIGCGAPEPAKTAPAPTPAAQAPAAAAPAPVEFGVPECDEYLTKYLTCIDSKVPEAARASVRQSVEQTKAAWKQAASTPEGKAGLAMGCKQATEAAKMAMTAYGCTF